jgi:hypothetical protein
MVQCLGTRFDYAYLPSIQTHGSIVVAWQATVSASNISAKPFPLLAHMRHTSGGPEWWLTSVYGPTQHNEKLGIPSGVA